MDVISLIATRPVCSAVRNSHTRHINFRVLQASPPFPASLRAVKQSASRKDSWAGKHVSSPTTWLSRIGSRRGRSKRLACSNFLHVCMNMHRSKANAVSISSCLHPFRPYRAVNTYFVHTHAHVLFYLTRSPFAALQAQLPKAAGVGRCSLLLKSLIVSCSTNTSPLFLCLLIPGIRRHGWVMTEMISLSTSPSITPRQLLHHPVSIHAWTGVVSWAPSLLKSLSHLPGTNLLFQCCFCFSQLFDRM